MSQHFLKLQMSIALAVLICALPLSLIAQNADSLHAASLLLSAEELTQKEEYEKSNTLAHQAISSFEKLKDWENFYYGYYALFENAFYQNSYNEFIEQLKKGVAKIPKSEIEYIAKMNGLLAYSFNATGNIFPNIQYNEANALIFKSLKDTVNLMTTYGNLGISYTKLGDNSKAIDFLENAILLASAKKDSAFLWLNYPNLAHAHFYKGDLLNAQKNFDAAQKLSDPQDGTFEFYNAEIQLEQKKELKALKLAKKALNLVKKNKEAPPIYQAITEELIGRIYLQLNQADNALRYFQKALPHYTSGPDKRELGKLQISIATAQTKAKKYNKALQTYQLALKTFIPSFKNNDPSTNPSESTLIKEFWLMEIFRGKSKCFFEKYKISKKEEWLYQAEKQLQLALDFIQTIKLNYDETSSKLLTGDHTHSFYGDLIKIKLTLYKETQQSKYQEEAFQIAQKANAFVLRELLNEQKSLQVAGVPKDKIDSLNKLQKEIISINYQIRYLPNANIDSLQQVRFDTKQIQRDFKNSLNNKYPDYLQLRNNLEVVSSTDLRKKLDASTLLIKYFLNDEDLYIFSVNKQGLRIQTVKVPSNLDILIQQYRTTLGDLDFIKSQPQLAEQQFLTSARQLYQLLLERPLDKLKPTSSQRLIIIADGILNAIPYQTLLHSESNSWTDASKFVISKHAVSYSYFCKMLLETSSTNPYQKDFVSFGLEFDEQTLQHLEKLTTDTITNSHIQENLRSSKLTNLPFSAVEARDLAQLMDGQSWLNDKASKNNFLKHAPHASILHMATHSILDAEHPNLSSLIFIKTKDSQDNLLRQEDIYQLKLQTDMVVLSACNTAIGKNQNGEGLNSLARAFNFAGASSTIATYWSIGDESSKKIMLLYYNYLKKGFTKDLAIQKAQLEYLESDAISSPAFRLPVYWAAWKPIGNMESIHDKSNVFLSNNWLQVTPFLLILFGLLFFIKKRLAKEG